MPRTRCSHVFAEKKKAGTSRSRPSFKRLNDRCQYIRGQRSETNFFVKCNEPLGGVKTLA